VYELDDGEVAALKGLATKGSPNGAMAFFVPAEGKEAEPEAAPDPANAEAGLSRDGLRAKARSLGVKVSGRESVQALREMIAEAEAKAEEA
jgi:hypothetical protein